MSDDRDALDALDALAAHLRDDGMAMAGESSSSRWRRRMTEPMEPMEPMETITSAADLLRAYAAGRRDFRAADLRRANLRDANLSDAGLSGWEPVIYRPSPRKRSREEPTVRDWLAASITMRKGLHGAKPEKFCFWLFDLLGMQPCDTLDDLYPGTGVVGRTWQQWRKNLWTA